MNRNVFSTLSRGTMLACCGVLVAAITFSANAGEIRWRSPADAGSTPGSVRGQMIAADALLQLSADTPHVVVQLNRPVSDQLRARLAESGVTLLDYLGDNAFFAVLDADLLDASAIDSTGALMAARAIEPIVKLHPVLAGGETPEWAVVNAETQERPIIGAYVMFHRDVDLATEAAPLMELYGATIRDALETVNALVVEVELDAIDALAQEDSIQWIEQALPRMSVNNDSNRGLTQVNTLQTAPYNLDGSGVTVLVYDGGTARASHNDFGGRCTVHDASGMHYHSTHVAGTIGGDGSASGGTYKGMAPNTTLLSYGFEYDGSGTFLYTNPGDIETDYADAIGLGADISNNSIGTNTETNGFPCSYQGDYGLTSSVIDTIVRGDGSDPDFASPFRIVWANGNERQGSRCDVEGYGDYYSTAPPAGAKNHLAIGALNSNDDSMTSFSSWGPVDDGRLKPDFASMGCQSNGDGGVTSTDSSSDTAYTTLCGTSMAAPTTAGMAALFLEDYRAQYPASADPRNSTLKAIFAQTAVDLGNTGPDYQFGYGSIRAKNAIDLMRSGSFYEDEITQGGVAEYLIVVSGLMSQLKVTIAWDDYPGTPNVNPALVNDLDVRVYDPSNNRYYPWTLDPSNPSAAAVQTQEDHVNNIEQVLVNSPVNGTWRVEVVGTTVPEGPQSFSICSSPTLVPTGIRYAFPGGLPSLMTPGVGETFDVEITSATETILAASETLHVRYDGGAYLDIPLANLGGGSYQATLPPAVCGATPEFYFSVEGDVSGVVTSPSDAPAGVFSATVGQSVVVFSDNFETDTGWTAANLGATSGDWQRGVPVNDPGWDYDPVSDSDGSGQCYLTQNVAGNTDVDGGAVQLTSPALDMSSGAIVISYDYYLYLTDTDGTDKLLVEIDSNGGAGPWTEIDRHDTNGGLSWRSNSINETELIAAGVTLTSNMVMRFTTNDGDTQSINESGLDAFEISGMECTAVLDDCNGNGIVDSDDISSGRSTDGNGNGIPDECDTVGCPGDVNSDGDIDLDDLAQLLAGYGITSGATFADGDLDGDGDVDLADLAALLAVYGTSCV